jgi:hypothetical protein
MRHLPERRVVFVCAAVWVGVELVGRFWRGRSIGEALLDLPPPRRAWIVDLLRYGVLLAWIGAAAFAPRLAGASFFSP